MPARNLGVLEADTGRAARGMLRERGLFPIDVASVSHSASSTVRRRRLRDSDLTLLTRQWATLLASGLTVEQALAALIEQSETEGQRQLLAGVRSEILRLQPARGARPLPQAFPMIYRASVAAGEKSGELAKVMNQLADYLERRSGLRQKTLQALLYPAIVAAVAMLVVIGLMTYVVPQVVTVFQQSKQALPWLTRALILLSDLLRNWGWLMVLVAAGGARGPLRAAQPGGEAPMACPPAAPAADRAPPQEPRRDPLRRHPVYPRRQRVALLSALDAGRQVLTMLPLQDAVSAATDKVREGQSLARALGATREFPPLLVHMIANGEATGRLGEMLDRAARLQQQEVETAPPPSPHCSNPCCCWPWAAWC